MRIVLVKLEIEEHELAQAHSHYVAEHNGRSAPSDAAAIARDLQVAAYDDGGMHGSFEVLFVSGPLTGCAGGAERDNG